MTIMGGLKTNVLNLANLVITNGTLTLSAPRGGEFIINISRKFSLSGGSKILLGGGLTPYAVLFNVTGAGDKVALTGGTTNGVPNTKISGIILAPEREISLSPGLVTGEVIGGGKQIAITSAGQVNNLEQLKATISAVPTLGSAPLEVQFNTEIQGGTPPYVYAWDFDGNGTVDDSRETFSYTYQQPGIYPVSLRITDTKGNSVLATVVINVTIANQNPTANPGTLYSGIIGVPVQFNGSGSTDPDGDPLTYSWKFGDGSTGSGVSPIHTYSIAGMYTVTLRVNDNRGGSSSAQAIAWVTNPLPSLSSMEPTSIVTGSPDLTLTLVGDNFLTTSLVSFNSQQFPVRFITKSQIETTIPATAIATPGSYPVKAINPALDAW